MNGLTPAEIERLAMLAEECGEVVQIVGKILRFGYESHHPDNPDVTNRTLLRQELTDIFGACHLMENRKDIDHATVGEIWEAMAKKLRASRHQGEAS